MVVAPDLFKFPKSPEPAGAAVLGVVDEEVPKVPNNPPELDTAAVADGAVLDVVVLAPPNRPVAAGVVDAGLFRLPKRPAEGAVVLVEADCVVLEALPNMP